jgi:hypothetical protein
LKRPIFTDCEGQPYFQDVHGDIRDHRGRLLGLQHEANIRAALRLMVVYQSNRQPTTADYMRAQQEAGDL